MLETQRCYICGKFYEDKVKLGLHLSPCYNEAVTVRREMWHPHPLDLVDEQRYTEYMRGKFNERENQIENARKQGVSFVTAENFDAIKGTLAQARNVPVTGLGGKSIGRGQAASPSPSQRPPSAGSPILPQVSRHVTIHAPVDDTRDLRQRDQVAAPVRQVATGVTMLRNELTEELTKIRQLRQTEEQLIGERQRVFEEMCGQMGSVRRINPQDSIRKIPPTPASPVRLMEPLLPRPQSSSSGVTPSQARGHMFPLARPPLGGPSALSSGPVSVPALTPSEIAPVEMPDGRLKCPWCGKLFGRKGYDVHAKRCSRPENDFTWSRDAEYVRENPEERVKADHDRVSYGRQFEGLPERPSNMTDAEWTQFMVTYPRPILDERPKSSQERGAMSSAQRNAYNQMVGNELSRGGIGGPEPTVPCRRCGRYFYSSRVSQHEATCLSRRK